MNPEIKAKWVAALRSGEYKQLQGALRSDNEAGSCFCCLGVLCDLYTEDKGIEWDLRKLEDESDAVPSTTVAAWARFSWDESGYAKDPFVVIDGKSKKLSAHNDTGRTFAEIADAIEAQL